MATRTKPSWSCTSKLAATRERAAEEALVKDAVFFLQEVAAQPK
jgi:hypothetical protein